MFVNIILFVFIYDSLARDFAEKDLATSYSAFNFSYKVIEFYYINDLSQMQICSLGR